METVDLVRTERERQALAAARRYVGASAERDENRRRRDAGHPVIASAPELVLRAERLARHGEVSGTAVAAAREAGAAAPSALERIIGASADLCAVSFLPRGDRAAAPVARISAVDAGRELPLGTGFLVSPRLLLTNHHVLPDTAAAGTVIVEFGAEVDVENSPLTPTRYRLAPGQLFLTDAGLDYTLVAVAPGPDGQPAGNRFGRLRLVAGQGKIAVGEAVNIIGHPSGRLKEISIRNNRLTVQLDDFLQYETDTEPGNSGSPVFNDQWEVVALHHSGVPRTDAEGRLLRRDGQPWRHGDGDDAVDWVANEGARVSRVLAHLAGQPLTGDQPALLAELGPESGLGGGAVPGGPEAVARTGLEAAVRAPARAGRNGRATAFGGTRALVFLHGRGQGGRDPERLRRSWAGGLNRGLTVAELPPIDPVDAWFPFYGDALDGAVARQESAGDADRTELLLYADLVREAAERAGMPSATLLADAGDDTPDGPAAPVAPLNTEGLAGFGAGIVRRLQPQLGWLAARSGLDQLAIGALFRDVAAYLDRPGVRRSVLDAVRATLPESGRIVLVSHSLGTVVAMDLLRELPADLGVDLLVTAGSPLGLDTVQDRLLARGPVRPAADRWLNVWSAADPVAIGCPLGDDWRGQLDEVVVDHDKDRAHDIAEYLAHAVVARPVGQALA